MNNNLYVIKGTYYSLSEKFHFILDLMIPMLSLNLLVEATRG